MKADKAQESNVAPEELADAMDMLGQGYDHPEIPEGFNAPNYTQSPNDFFDYYLKRIDTLAELKVVCAFIRFTFGYHRNGFKMGVDELAEYTGLSRNSVTSGAEAAEQRKILKRLNPNENKKAEWGLFVRPSKFEGQTLRDSPSKFEGLSGVKESNKEIDDDERVVQERTSLMTKLYEANISHITALAADIIRNTVIDYPNASWYEPAFKIAVGNNKRHINYVLAILQGWKEHYFGWKPEFKNGNGRKSVQKKKELPPPSGKYATAEEVDAMFKAEGLTQ